MLNRTIPRKMIVMAHHNARFGMRVAGIAIHEGHVLLQHTAQGDFWFLPGGRVEMLEPAAESLRREMKEEIDADVTVVRLLWVIENFFEENKLGHHELGMYFLIDPGSHFPYYDKTQPFYGREDGLGDTPSIRLTFRWFPIAQIADTYLFPTFLRTALQDLPQHTQHIVHYDVDDGGT